MGGGIVCGLKSAAFVCVENAAVRRPDRLTLGAHGRDSFIIMKFRSIRRLGLLALFLTGSFQTQAGPKPVMVHYMPWFVSQPYSGGWGWHWTMGHFNPNLTNTNGQQQIASWYYPLIGPYDSADPAVLEYHVLLMKLGGIDGVIVDWYGNDSYADYSINDQRTSALLYYTRKAGLKFSLCYEDATIQTEINANYIPASAAVAHAQQTLLYAQSNYFRDASYYRLQSQPVFLNFGPQYFKTNTQWQSIFSILDATNQPAFFTEDNRLPVGTGAFDWPPMWMTATNAGVLSTNQLTSYLSNFDAKGSAWPGYVSGGFPRFHDIYAQAGVQPSYGYLDDRNGDTFRETLARAMTNNSKMVQVITWNDFGEGTVVEPTADFGYRDLGIIQDSRRQYLDSTFAYHTNDLVIPTRLYTQRKRNIPANNPVVTAELDRVFTNAVNGNLAVASLQLSGVESNHPVIYGLSSTGGQLQFLIGGYLSSSGVMVQTSSVPGTGTWQTISTIAGSTNQFIFNTPIAPQGPPTFFRVQNAGP
ncbi:MAG: hypothetical protein JWR26_3958 [Pedosphaera sp.]|nr:hypothetical protein [Pedosphaera sp.]